jgi:hypothetical protein
MDAWFFLPSFLLSRIAKLQEVSAAGTQRMQELALEWDRHRGPLAAQLAEKEDTLMMVRPALFCTQLCVTSPLPCFNVFPSFC